MLRIVWTKSNCPVCGDARTCIRCIRKAAIAEHARHAANVSKKVTMHQGDQMLAGFMAIVVYEHGGEIVHVLLNMSHYIPIA